MSADTYPVWATTVELSASTKFEYKYYKSNSREGRRGRRQRVSFIDCTLLSSVLSTCYDSDYLVVRRQLRGGEFGLAPITSSAAAHGLVLRSLSLTAPKLWTMYGAKTRNLTYFL